MEEFGTEQLIEFCQRLGLARDGYLDEKDLAIVCNCIGLQAPEEMLKEVFEDLDTDKDGRVGLEELSQMLRGMPKAPPSPEKRVGVGSSSSSSQPSASVSSAPLRPEFSLSNGMGDLSQGFSILDPQHSGFTKAGLVLDMWAQWGIRSDEGLQILKDLGFPVTSRSHSLNVQDLTKALEEEADNAKDALPIVVTTALLTYKSEAQYLRSICESMEGERDKLRSDVMEAHQRSSILAQEVDEQNARLEKNSQLLLHKMEAKYTEQVQDLHLKFATEKESIQQALSLADAQLKALQEEDAKLKLSMNKLNKENSDLEREVEKLSKEMRTLGRTKDQLENEMTRFAELESRLVDAERRNAETLAMAEAKISQARGEAQELRDQNDELSTQVETLREKIKALKAFQEKRTSNKRRKGSSSNASACKSLSLEGLELDADSPLEKMGKFLHLHEIGGAGDITMFADDAEDLETSLASYSSQPDSGTFPVPIAINLGVCMGETSTDSSLPHVHTRGRNPHSLEREMETEIIKAGVETITITVDKRIDVDTQTEGDSANSITPTVEELQSRVSDLEQRLQITEQERADLDSSLELLRVEYEKMEDYWQDKLQESRDFSEQERVQMDNRLCEMMDKIKEYDEAFMCFQQGPQRLPPIEERASLEQQVTDLETECEGLRNELRSLKVGQDSIISSYQRQWEARAMDECTRLEQQVCALTKKCHEYESRLSSLAEEERSMAGSGMVDLLHDRVEELEFQLKSQEDTFRLQISDLEERLKKFRARKNNKGRAKRKDSSSPNSQQLSSPSPTHSSSTSTASTATANSPPPPPPQVWCNEEKVAENNNNNDLNEWREKSKTLLEILHHQASLKESQVENPKGHESFDVSPYFVWPQRYATPNASVDSKSASLPFFNIGPDPWDSGQNNHPAPTQNGWGVMPPTGNAWGEQQTPTNGKKKAWAQVEVGWLQGLRAKLKQRENQCHSLQKLLRDKEIEMERVLAELKYKHDSERLNWDNALKASQEFARQQAEKLAQSEVMMQNLWMENARLMNALSVTEQRVLHLETVLKTQQPHPLQAHPLSNPPRSLPYHQTNFSA